MSQFAFRYPEWRDVEPRAWLDYWAGRYNGGDNNKYFELIEKHDKLSKEDFEQVGKWKEGCLKPNHGSWKTGTPKAYDVWMQTKTESPKCPEQDDVAGFLEGWSTRTFVAGEKNSKVLIYRFGLSRATTVLPFISGGQYPIFDSRVSTAMIRLGSPVEKTIEGYLNSFCPLFSEVAGICGVSEREGLRRLDNALFTYGADASFPVSLSSLLARPAEAS
jgi:hypothetical protein